MNYIEIEEKTRALANSLLKEYWSSTRMVIRGSYVELADAPGIFAVDDSGESNGLITYIIHEEVCEITSLNSLREGCGIGSNLLERVIQTARSQGCKKIRLITTNDNINALRFYQKRGFDLVCIYRNALDVSRKLKPEIPLLGEDGIPLRHEIELEQVLVPFLE